MSLPAEPLDTATIYSDLLAERAQQEKFDPKEIRLSEAGLCGRKQTLRALGYKPEDLDERSLSIFQTGDEHEDAIYHLWAERFPRRVKRQIKVVSPFGVGHIDIWVAPLQRLIESKSTTEKSVSRLPMESHLDQVTLYLHFWGLDHGATAEIAYRVKETGQVISFPVPYDKDRAEKLVSRLNDIQAAIELFRSPLPIPEGYGPTHFPCAWFTPQGMARCPLWQHCWGEGVSTKPGDKGKVIASVPSLTATVEEYRDLDVQRKSAAAKVEEIKQRQDEIEGIFDKVLDDASANALAANGIIVSRSRIPGRATPDIEGAIAAGLFTAAQIEPFLNEGKGYNRWYIKGGK